MVESQYEEIVRTSLQRFRDLYDRREEIDVELVKLRQFLYATLNMVPEKQKAKWRNEIDAAVNRFTVNAASLADSIRKIISDHPNMIYTVGGIKEALGEAGFDFSSYTSNPLSSVSTTLRRMVDTGELLSKEDSEGTAGFIPSDKFRVVKSKRYRRI